ncbi:hypothetical protein A6R68_17412 [Neotoma lepida]|uniref:Uncharacterized protein n=1 Tax=Neotoma lepida TaxID=56216 RepID=A0A1A6HC39_NEOLE|nr:hypothetical protein A6R68_17412 [Neotoma lepida]
MESMNVEIKVMSCVAKVAKITLSFVSRVFAFQSNTSAMVKWTALQEKMRVAVKDLHVQIKEEKLKKQKF